MHKAFLFDLDGVLINDEAIWEAQKQRLFKEILGDEVSQKLGSTLGVNMDGIYERAVTAGTKVSRERLVSEFQKLASDIYSTAPISDGAAALVATLQKLDYHIGIVSASPLSWITAVTKRMSFQDAIEIVISLHERSDLKHKPEPDGYLEAMRVLDAAPSTTIVLEDSNSGIASAKASGAYTIGLRQNLVQGYVQTGADTYAATMDDVVKLVEQRKI